MRGISAIGFLVSAAIVALLMLFFLQGSISTGPQDPERDRKTVDRARDLADDVEQSEQERGRRLDEALE